MKTFIYGAAIALMAVTAQAQVQSSHNNYHGAALTTGASHNNYHANGGSYGPSHNDYRASNPEIGASHNNYNGASPQAVAAKAASASEGSMRVSAPY